LFLCAQPKRWWCACQAENAPRIGKLFSPAAGVQLSGLDPLPFTSTEGGLNHSHVEAKYQQDIRMAILNHAFACGYKVIPDPDSDEDWHCLECFVGFLGGKPKTLQNKLAQVPEEHRPAPHPIGPFYKYRSVIEALKHAKEIPPPTRQKGREKATKRRR